MCCCDYNILIFKIPSSARMRNALTKYLYIKLLEWLDKHSSIHLLWCKERVLKILWDYPVRVIYYCRNRICEQFIDTVASFSDRLLPTVSTNILFILLSIQLLSSMCKRSDNPCADFKSEISYTQFINENVSMFDNQKQIGQKRPYRSLRINIFLSFSSY